MAPALAWLCGALMEDGITGQLPALQRELTGQARQAEREGSSSLLSCNSPLKRTSQVSQVHQFLPRAVTPVT